MSRKWSPERIKNLEKLVDMTSTKDEAFKIMSTALGVSVNSVKKAYYRYRKPKTVEIVPPKKRSILSRLLSIFKRNN